MVSNNRSSKKNERKIAKKKIRNNSKSKIAKKKKINKGLCGRWGLIQRILLNFLRRNHQWQAQALSHRSNENSKRKNKFACHQVVRVLISRRNSKQHQ